LQQGEKSAGLYVIIHGIAVVTTRTLGKDVLNLLTIEHGNFVGEIGALVKGIYTTTVIANTEVEALLIPNEYFEMLSFFFPETKYKISKSVTEEVCNRLKIIHQRIVNYIQQENLKHTSLYEDIIKSLVAKKTITFEEATIDIKLLRENEFFKIFSDKEFTTLVEHSELILVPKNFTLRKAGEINLSCHIILRGAVQSSIEQNNKIAKLSIFEPVELFSSISMIDNSPALLNYTTREKTILLQIDPSHLTNIQTTNRELWLKIYELICKSFVRLERMANKLDIRLNSESYR
jgi:CRP-like cAMP-binding protein